MTKSLFISLLLLSPIIPSCAQKPADLTRAVVPAKERSVNGLILQSVRSMPNGGGYEASQAAVDRLAAGVTSDEKFTHYNLVKIGPSFCSGATYLVLLRTINKLQSAGELTLPAKTLARFATCGVDDGEELFGRWNANGPGAAKLVADLGCGTNFTSYAHAKPGDIMKMWWTDAIGKRERGHLVIYLGATGDTVHYWSSNTPGGYGKKSTTKDKIKHVLFSRITKPSDLANAAKLSPRDKFLADMLRKDFTWSQVAKTCKVTETPEE